MTDPYEILNIPSTATDDEIKKAYRELARKYHPDNYHDNPLADLAQEKMKEINAAYDAIQKERSGRGRPGGSSGGYEGYAARQPGYGGYQYRQQERAGGSPAFQHVRMAICYRRGWVDEARRYYQTACQMSPGDLEYRQALHFVENNGEGYRPEGYEIFSTGCGGNNLCAQMACGYAVCMGASTCGMRFLCC